MRPPPEYPGPNSSGKVLFPARPGEAEVFDGNSVNLRLVDWPVHFLHAKDVSGDHAYVADKSPGLQVFQVLQIEINSKNNISQSISVNGLFEMFGSAIEWSERDFHTKFPISVEWVFSVLIYCRPLASLLAQ